MRALYLLLTVVGASLVSAADAHFTSGPRQVPLVELFTSEGCSSCPPAEKWMGERRSDPNLWTHYVPVAFHVAYWDHLGWRDQFAQRVYTDRQRAYAAQWSQPSVYTPCFVRNAQEWRPGNPAETTDRSSGRLSLRELTPGEWELRFTPSSDSAHLVLEGHASLLGGGIVSQVKAGENEGRTLSHEFVALNLVHIALQKEKESADYTAVVRLPQPEIKTARRSIAAWVTAEGSLVPLQAVGGELK